MASSAEKAWVAIVVASIVAVGGIAAAVIPRMIDDPAPDPVMEVAIDRVTPREKHKGVSEEDGLQASGPASNLPSGTTLWLMDKDVDSFTIDEEAEQSGGRWSASSYPLGDGKAVPFDIRIAVVMANTDCANTLRKILREDESYLESLPKGCQEMHSRAVNVTEP